MEVRVSWGPTEAHDIELMLRAGTSFPAMAKRFFSATKIPGGGAFTRVVGGVPVPAEAYVDELGLRNGDRITYTAPAHAVDAAHAITNFPICVTANGKEFTCMVLPTTRVRAVIASVRLLEPGSDGDGGGFMRTRDSYVIPGKRHMTIAQAGLGPEDRVTYIPSARWLALCGSGYGVPQHVLPFGDFVGSVGGPAAIDVPDSLLEPAAGGTLLIRVYSIANMNVSVLAMVMPTTTLGSIAEEFFKRVPDLRRGGTFTSWGEWPSFTEADAGRTVDAAGVPSGATFVYPSA